MAVTITNNSRSPLILHDEEGQSITIAPGGDVEAKSFSLKHPVHTALKASGEITVEGEAEADTAKDADADAGKGEGGGDQEFASWSKAPESYEIGDNTVPAETVLKLAADKAEADVAAWNALTVAKRKDFVEAAVAQLQAEAAAGKGEGGGGE
ncbi:hypothetical protein [Oceanicaulis sp.]|uniref:hypothetical protein n=1 Tax=Oceanicaulis sp. TaxID=1924941 RepID=UPI003F6E6A0B